MANRLSARRRREDPVRFQARRVQALGPRRDRSLHRQRMQAAKGKGGADEHPGRPQGGTSRKGKAARMRLTPCSKPAATSSSGEPVEPCSSGYWKPGPRRPTTLPTGSGRPGPASTRDGSAPYRDRSPSPGSSGGPATRKSARPIRHASVLTVWELADRAGALAWLARNPDLPDPPEPDDEAGAPSPAPSGSPSPTPLAVALTQPTSLLTSPSPSAAIRWARHHP